ncbi:MAG: hypothetical protein IJ057_02405 [Bacteroidales bacterium]|nr:hypothetical protein [Bacteroidales bacterium]
MVKPDDDSVSKAAFWFGEAAKEGLGDAVFEFALLHLYGYYGPDIHVCAAADWPQASALVHAQRLAPIRMDGLARLSEEQGLAGRLTLWTNHLAPRKAMAQNEVASRLCASYIAGDVILTMEDGKAYLLNSTSDGLVMLEEDIYDPLRFDSLHELGQKLALPGRLTAWFDNTALRKQQVYLNTIDDNPLGSSIYQGKVTDNFFIALENDRFLPMPFKDEASLKQVLEALGIAPEHVILP